MPEPELRALRQAAELHDVGKLRSPRRSQEAGAALERRVGLRPPAHADRRADPGCGAGPGSGGKLVRSMTSTGTGAATPTTGRLGDTARRADHCGLRLVRRHDFAATVRESVEQRAGDPRALRRRGDAVRPGRGRGVRGRSGGPDRPARRLDPRSTGRNGREAPSGAPLTYSSMILGRARSGRARALRLSRDALDDLGRVLLLRSRATSACETTPTRRSSSAVTATRGPDGAP